MAGAHGKRQKPVSYIRHPYEDELAAVKAESFFFFRLRRVTRTFHVLAVQNYDKEVYKKKCAARAKSFFFLPIRFIVLLFFFFTVLVTVSLFRIFVCVNYKYMNESFALSPC